jgi:hypothetical protein
MTCVKRIHIRSVARHRNGIGGAPFHVAIFDACGGRKVGIVFEEPGHCAVLDIARLAAGDIAFGSNSWRGDRYEPHLREAIAGFSNPQA